jgi:cellulose synthase/poly-beta-1,6-N-acetylglucosamine synthase-like glycosyltransferase
MKLHDPTPGGVANVSSIPTEPTGANRKILVVLVGLGALTATFYFEWWLRAPVGRLALIVLPLTLFYHAAQIFIPWTLFLNARRAPAPPPQRGLSVDVFVVAYKEPAWLVKKTLKAAVNMQYPHRTFLLDDGRRSELASAARALGAGYITRSNNKHAKAGNINHALEQTDGDIIVIFDTDHTPKPEFLLRSLGHFRNSRVGFVQVMQTFSNRKESFISRAATETTDEFFGPICIGMDSWDSCTLFGTNALIRRSALVEIGGYQPGLTEDLATSIELHAAKWGSRYVHEPLAPGLSPSDLRAFFVQQFKWALGVFGLLFTVYPRRFFNMTWKQRLCYLTRMTCYLAGPYCAAHILLAFFLLFGSGRTHDVFLGYALRYLPLFAVILTIQAYSVHHWSREPARLRWRAISLVYSTWPVYVAALCCAIFRWKVDYLPTPKVFQAGNHLPLAAPQLFAAAGLLVGLTWLMNASSFTQSSVAIGTFAALLVLANASLSIGVIEGFRSRPIKRTSQFSVLPRTR